MSKQQDFINKIAPLAKADMAKTGVLASLTIAQAILESGWGESGLTQVSNNLFGIKGSYNGQFVNYETFEYYSGVKTKITDKFKKYANWSESISDHSVLFLNKDRYHNLIGEKDYTIACKKVQADGYATAPTYADELIKIIEQYKLYEYDGGDRVQKLILPINKAKLTASMYNTAYVNKFGWIHYGVDMVSSAYDTKLYASGTGIVVASGWDDSAGYTVIIRYNGVYNHVTGNTNDIVFRYYHMNSLSVKKGVAVNKDTVIGYYGGSGSGKMDKWSPHLHLEADYDVEHPNFTPQYSKGSAILKGSVNGANAKTMFSALEVLHCKQSAPDNQTYTTNNDIYINEGDKEIPYNY